MTKQLKQTHTVYFIGAGPGAPKYLTLEGSDALADCRLVYAMEPYPETFGQFLEGKEIRDPFDRVFGELLEEVGEELSSASVGFLVPGDITAFSPFLPLVEHFGERASVIAGVGIINAAAAVLKRALDMPGISHSIVMTSPKHFDKSGHPEKMAELARAAGTMVLYMNNRPLDQLAQELGDGFASETPVAIVSRIGLAGEMVYRGTLATISSVVGEDDIFGLVSGDPSMAIVLVGDVLETASDPTFWNKRKKKFWDRQRNVSE